LDPWHFYYGFTFGTAYAIVLSLYYFGYIKTPIFLIVMFYGFLMCFAINLFCRIPHSLFARLLNVIICPGIKNQSTVFYFILAVYFLITSLIVYNIGFGFLAETNRFDQNKGFGPLVRVADSLRLFIAGYIGIVLYNGVSGSFSFTLKKVALFIFLLFFIVFSALLNGAKFAFLESLYVIFTALVAYGAVLRLSLLKVGFIFFFALFFSTFVLIINLKSNGIDSEAESQFFTGVPVIAERFILRILANGDKYYLLLPDNIIDKIETDNIFVRLLSPIVGVTKLSSIVGYNVGDYTVGRQAILYWYPGYEVPGGPTSHFDLFAYKYCGIGLGALFIIFIAWIMAGIRYFLICSKNNSFVAALAAALWLRALALLLEPPMGLAYVFDILILFCIFKVLGAIVNFASRPVRS
jgi:hypothetical protein